MGFLLILGGVFELVFAFKAPSFGRGVLVFLFGGLSIVAGAFLAVMPDLGLGAMTWLLAGFFVAAGIVDIVLAGDTAIVADIADPQLEPDGNVPIFVSYTLEFKGDTMSVRSRCPEAPLTLSLSSVS